MSVSSSPSDDDEWRSLSIIESIATAVGKSSSILLSLGFPFFLLLKKTRKWLRSLLARTQLDGARELEDDMMA